MKINTLSLIITLSGLLFVSISFVIIILGKKVGDKGAQKIKIKNYIEINTNSVIFLILIMSCLSLAPLTFVYWKPDLAKCIDELSIAKNEIDQIRVKKQLPIRIKVMDSNEDYNVYNTVNAALGGTNTQEILGVLALKKGVEFTAEIVNPSWRDYDKVIQENPDILIIHNSSFKIRKIEIVNGEERGEIENDYERIFLSFLNKISSSTTTHFLIYSRKEVFKNSESVINRYVGKIPNLKDRITVLYVNEEYTFLKPEVAVELSDLVDRIIRKIKEDRV